MTKTKQNNILKVFNITVVIAILTFVFMAFHYRNNPLDFNLFGYKPFVFTSNAMAPTFDKNSISLGKKYEGQELKKGDIVTFTADVAENCNYVITHRIVDIKDDGTIITKGDNNKNVDNFTITKDDIKYIHS